MATVRELLDLLMSGGEDLPETIYDDLSGAYNSEAEGFATAVSDHDSALAAKDAEIAKLKAANYDLLINSGVEIPGASAEESEEATSEVGDEETGDEETPLESLFGDNAEDDDENDKE